MPATHDKTVPSTRLGRLKPFGINGWSATDIQNSFNNTDTKLQLATAEELILLSAE